MFEPPVEPGQTWRLSVKGSPVAQGALSATPIMRRDPDDPDGQRKIPVTKANGVPVVTQWNSSDAKLKGWRNEIAVAACKGGWDPIGRSALDEPLVVRLRFFVKRPDNQEGTGRNAGVLKDSADLYPMRTGSDVDKYTRAVFDALTGIVWKDDRRVVDVRAQRRYGSPERVEIAVRRLRVTTLGELRRLRDLNPVAADAIAADLQLALV